MPGNIGHWCQDLSPGKIERECKMAGPYSSEIQFITCPLASPKTGVQSRKRDNKLRIINSRLNLVTKSPKVFSTSMLFQAAYSTTYNTGASKTRYCKIEVTTVHHEVLACLFLYIFTINLAALV